ncbi:MAG: CPBP family intramembrane metalloprotease [Planctomycetales bacterium]|nr:CPBP family intramembrane metalloprotease [Planctomycetales bacterium]
MRGLVLYYVLSLGGILLAGALVGDERMAVNAEAGIFIGLTLLWSLRRRRDVAPVLRTIGLGPVGYGLVTVGALVSYAAAEALSSGLSRLLGIPEPTLREQFGGPGASLAWLLLLVAVEPAVFEEIAFRGVIQGGLARAFGRREALWASAILFAVIHLNPVTLPFLLLLGLYMGLLREKTGSLYPGMLAHFGHNGLLVVADHLGFDLL